ncbi:unnamed protein product [Albugo candida]|uniref:non-specific serine/threonine protein kinase n=1 Tax=Albugo candida TaxID=65357 RepID=A0A024GPU8_9STRA|nr:unnamed protein product [Albugo candida]|eukprot:CCI48819.1 unnamed protein product [Albugo candida]
MHSELRDGLHIQQVDYYDGQSIFCNSQLCYSLGEYLGGGTAGVYVELSYSSICVRLLDLVQAVSTKLFAIEQIHVAIKILNPVGYKLVSPSFLPRCLIAVRGKAVTTALENPHELKMENVFWLIHPTTKQVITAWEDPTTQSLKELHLAQCIALWKDEITEADAYNKCIDTVMQHQRWNFPRIPRKFLKFLEMQRCIRREMAAMSRLKHHNNVLKLEEVLEFVEEAKCTTFLVLELATGGDLFDRLRNRGADEEFARFYFRQLVEGVAFCHASGICHRDLKLDNLILADDRVHSVLKIADFGLSAIVSKTTGDHSDGKSNFRRLQSVIGSPYYVAPEALHDAGTGYDGFKADGWSIGVILYAMVTGVMPFGKNLPSCPRFACFKSILSDLKHENTSTRIVDSLDLASHSPNWLFPSQLSDELKGLLSRLLHPDPCSRLSVEECLQDPWVLKQTFTANAPICLELCENKTGNSPVFETDSKCNFSRDSQCNFSLSKNNSLSSITSSLSPSP